MSRELACSVCAHRYNPETEGACLACPMHKGCPLVCCPNCGLVTVDIERSQLVRLATAVAGRRHRSHEETGAARSLADIPPGTTGVVKGYCAGFPAARRRQLEAYGVSEGRDVMVIQHSPVTVFRVDHTELALETELARAILVAS